MLTKILNVKSLILPDFALSVGNILYITVQYNISKFSKNLIMHILN